MEKVFKPENKHKLDSDQRRKLAPPEAVLDLMEIEKGDTLRCSASRISPVLAGSEKTACW